MKLRHGFVSNSSSSSFAVKKKDLTEDQIKAIRDHIKYANEHEIKCGKCGENRHESRDSWNIYENDREMGGDTLMDNFYMHLFLSAIGVDLTRVDLDTSYF